MTKMNYDPETHEKNAVNSLKTWCTFVTVHKTNRSYQADERSRLI